MISEKEFARNDFQKLLDPPHNALRAEMAVVNEWIVRDPLFPDFLLTVYVCPFPDGTIHAACSCTDGAQDRPCLHALKVITELKSQGHLIEELFKPREKVAAA